MESFNVNKELFLYTNEYTPRDRDIWYYWTGFIMVSIFIDAFYKIVVALSSITSIVQVRPFELLALFFPVINTIQWVILFNQACTRHHFDAL